MRAGEVKGLTWEDQLADGVRRELLTDAEAEQLKEVRALVMEIIAVDEFTTEEMAAGRKPQPPVDTQHAA